jgi:hypothetical protein
MCFDGFCDGSQTRQISLTPFKNCSEKLVDAFSVRNPPRKFAIRNRRRTTTENEASLPYNGDKPIDFVGLFGSLQQWGRKEITPWTNEYASTCRPHCGSREKRQQCEQKRA